MNNNSLYRDLSWNVFEKTGDVSVFLEYKQFGDVNKSDEYERVPNEGISN